MNLWYGKIWITILDMFIDCAAFQFEGLFEKRRSKKWKKQSKVWIEKILKNAQWHNMAAHMQSWALRNRQWNECRIGVSIPKTWPGIIVGQIGRLTKDYFTVKKISGNHDALFEEILLDYTETNGLSATNFKCRVVLRWKKRIMCEIHKPSLWKHFWPKKMDFFDTSWAYITLWRFGSVPAIRILDSRDSLSRKKLNQSKLELCIRYQRIQIHYNFAESYSIAI